MTADRLRGRRRVELAQQLADRCRTDPFTITVTGLSAEVGRRPSVVRQLLAEGGLYSWLLLVGLSDDEVTAELACRFRRGVPVQRLAEVTGLDQRVIRERLRGAGVGLETRTPRADLAMPVPELVERYIAGATLADLAALSGRCFGTVRRVLLDAGVELRGRGGSRSAGEVSSGP